MWQRSVLVEVLIKCCGCNISATWFAGVALVITGNSGYVILIYWPFSYGEFLTNPYKASKKRRISFVEHFLTNFILKIQFITIQFLNNPRISVRLCTDQYRSVQIRRESSTWAVSLKSEFH